MTRPTGMKLLRRAEPFLRVLAVVAGAAAMLMPTGCATRNQGPVAPAEFFPAPPAPPRLQYLTSLSRPEDFEPPPNALLTYLVGRPPARRALAKPYGVAMKDGRIFICDSQTATIHVLSLEEREWEYFMPSGAGRLRKPINIDVDDQGNRYVADTQQGRILVYDAEGRYLNAVGQDMDMKPVDVLVAEDYLYVADLQSHVVRVFNRATRELLRMIPADPKNEKERLYAPTNLAIGTNGVLYVSDTGAFRVQKYDREGQYLGMVGGHGDAPGQFARNKGIAVDREGRLYVVDAASEAVQIFDREGRLLLFFGNPADSTNPLVLPSTVLIDYDHVDFFRSYAAPDFSLEYLVLVVSQYGERKISVYGFGHTAVKP